MRFRTVSETESACEDSRLLKMIFRNAITAVTPTSATPVTMVLDMREQSIARDVQCRADGYFSLAAFRRCHHQARRSNAVRSEGRKDAERGSPGDV
jgi:hypothetical protein